MENSVLSVDEIRSLEGHSVGPWTERVRCTSCRALLTEKYKRCNAGPCPDCGARSADSGSPPQMVEVWRRVSISIRLRSRFAFWKGPEWMAHEAWERTGRGLNDGPAR
jgi:hypothetical protein